ncbi:hypothetical protein REPUB_Repub13aG0001700 [Reevesia pubescens]
MTVYNRFNRFLTDSLLTQFFILSRPVKPSIFGSTGRSGPILITLVEGDSLLLVCAIKNQEKNHSAAGAIIESIKLLVPSFNKFHLQPTRRKRNEVAHCLAKHSKALEDFVVWLKEFPSFLASFVHSKECSDVTISIN